MVRITVVVATDENGLIGAAGGMPWHLPADLKHFKNTTMGHPILMGRTTHEAIGRALPGRDNLVLTRNADFKATGCTIVRNLDAALACARQTGSDELMVIGGAQVYALALPQAHRIVLTRIHAEFAGDTWFPAIDDAMWDEVQRQDCVADQRNPVAYSFITLQRRG